MNDALLQGFLNTPPLWENQSFGIKQFEMPVVGPNRSLSHPIPDHLRLGHQIEHVFRQVLARSADHRILLHNKAIRKDKITLGEIDFIMEQVATRQVVHVELSYKFYLILPNIQDPVQALIGPNRRDTFFRKLEKIRNKQFPLLHSPEGREVLIAQGINTAETHQQCCFKAQLFRHYTTEQQELDNFNRACLAGYWLHFNDFEQAEFASATYYMPGKREWVFQPHLNVVWKPYGTIRKMVSEQHDQQRAPMLWKKNADGSIEKLFVVDWQ